MNIVITIMLIFACIGLIDKFLGNRFHLAEEFDKGIALMGPMALALVGITCIGIYAAQANADVIESFSKVLPFDASVLIGSVLAPDMGGLSISLQIASDRAVGFFSGMLIATTLGVTVCFQLPVCLSGIRGREDTDILMKGFVIGLAVIPPGIIIGGLLLGLNIVAIFINFLPILIICIVLVIGFKKSAHITARILTLFGNLIQVLTLILFGVVMAGVFIPSISIADSSAVSEVFVTTARMACIVCGSLVFSKLALRFLKKPFAAAAGLLKTNEYSIIGLILSMTTTFAMLPLFSKMDTRGKLINAAFSVGGAYIIGGQMAYVSTLATDWELAVFFIAKILIGVCAIVAACFVESRLKGPTETLPEKQTA